MGFRFTAFNTANRYNLLGYVRNLPDGTVEMIVQGQPQDIDDCIRDIKQSFGGYVKQTKAEQIPLKPTYEDFKITF